MVLGKQQTVINDVYMFTVYMEKQVKELRREGFARLNDLVCLLLIEELFDYRPNDKMVMNKCACSVILHTIKGTAVASIFAQFKINVLDRWDYGTLKVKSGLFLLFEGGRRVQRHDSDNRKQCCSPMGN